jgi:hypothetical protein
LLPVAPRTVTALNLVEVDADFGHAWRAPTDIA